MLEKIIKNMITYNLIFILISLLVRIFYTFHIFYFILGIMIGLAFTICKLVMLNRSITRSVNMQKNIATMSVLFNYFVRYLFTGILLYIMISKSFELFLGSVISMTFITKMGLFTIKGSVFDGGREGV